VPPCHGQGAWTPDWGGGGPLSCGPGQGALPTGPGGIRVGRALPTTGAPGDTEEFSVVRHRLSRKKFFSNTKCFLGIVRPLGCTQHAKGAKKKKFRRPTGRRGRLPFSGPPLPQGAIHPGNTNGETMDAGENGPCLRRMALAEISRFFRRFSGTLETGFRGSTFEPSLVDAFSLLT